MCLKSTVSALPCSLSLWTAVCSLGCFTVQHSSLLPGQHTGVHRTQRDPLESLLPASPSAVQLGLSACVRAGPGPVLRGEQVPPEPLVMTSLTDSARRSVSAVYELCLRRDLAEGPQSRGAVFMGDNPVSVYRPNHVKKCSWYQ